MNLIAVQFSFHLGWIALPVMGFAALVALVALVSPRCFGVLARGGGRWFDTNKIVHTLDQPIDIDRHVIRHSRLFGVVLLAAIGLLAYLYYVGFLGGTLPF